MKKFLPLILFCVMGCANPMHEHLPVCMVSPDIEDYGEAGRYGITYYSDLDKAKECSVSTGRKILLMFTGYACVSSTGQEWKILREESVRQLINDQFILVVLYVDDKTSLPVVDSVDWGNEKVAIETVGQKCSALESNNFKQNSQPFYVVVDTALNAIVPGCGYTKDSVAFADMLETALEK